jgi:hypothetical protein
MKHMIVIILVLLAAVNALGQSKITAFHYDISLPDQGTKDFIDETSWLGFGFDGRWFVNADVPVTLGIALGWHVFDKETSETIVFDNGALSGHQHRYLNSFPIMLTGHYYFGDKERLWAFVGAGVGTYCIIQRFEVGVFAFEETNWHFGVYPEVGLQIPLQEVDLFVSARYNYAFEAGESLSGQAKDYNYWGINLGFAYNGW